MPDNNNYIIDSTTANSTITFLNNSNNAMLDRIITGGTIFDEQDVPDTERLYIPVEDVKDYILVTPMINTPLAEVENDITPKQFIDDNLEIKKVGLIL